MGQIRTVTNTANEQTPPHLCPNCGGDSFSSQPVVVMDLHYMDDANADEAQFDWSFGDTVGTPEFRCGDCDAVMDYEASLKARRIILK